MASFNFFLKVASGPSHAPSTGGAAHGGDSIILEEEIDPNYEPTEEEVMEYAKWLGKEYIYFFEKSGN